MSRCKGDHKEPKHLPYGATRRRYWCWGCDATLVPEWYGPHPKPIKKRERRRAKKEIEQELLPLGRNKPKNEDT